MHSLDIITNILFLVSIGVYGYWMTGHQIENETTSMIFMILAGMAYIVGTGSIAMTGSEIDRTNVPFIAAIAMIIFTTISATVTGARYLGEVSHDITLTVIVMMPIITSLIMFYVEWYFHKTVTTPLD